MLNDYFHKQFSHSSAYDIDVNFSNDELYDIDFSCTRIKKLLDNINTNKAAGPDGIHGCNLKYCSISVCRPLSMIYKLVYNTGIILEEWKSANIVTIIDPLSEGPVTPPLRVEKLSTRLNFFDNMFSCIP